MPEIAGYQDLEVVGRGGFAVVYKARQISVGRDVAIKLLTDPAPDDDLIRRFQRESKAVGALSWHPHIAAVVDAGSTAQGQAYIVFELLMGGSLEERIADEPMTWTEAVPAMIRVADAVEAAHSAEVLHRDIKPANILMDRLGVAKLGDFGIASMQDGTKTETGMLATTVAHAAPELFDGEPSSTATDVYALGSTLHNLVTGTPPFTPHPGERVSVTIAKILSEPPPRPDPTVVPDVLATVIAHALAKQAQYRPRSAAAFGQALQQAQRDLGQPVTAMPFSDKQSASSAPPAGHAPPNPTPPASQAPAGQAPHPGLAPPNPTAAPAGQAPHPGLAPPNPTAAPAGHTAPNPSPTPPAPIQPTPSVASAPAKPSRAPLRKTIMVLSMLAVVLAAAVGVLLLRERANMLITAGGAQIAAAKALPATEMLEFPGAQALDLDDTTYWGIAPAADGTGVRGTSFVITLSEEQTIVRVGISNGTSTELGRVTGIIWGTSIADLGNGADNVVRQELEDAPGEQTTAFRVTTSQVVLALTGVHGDEVNAGIAEILIEVEE